MNKQNSMVLNNTKNSKKVINVSKKGLSVEIPKDEKITLELEANVNGKKLEKILTDLQSSKKEYKNEANNIRNSLSTNLRILKDECKKGTKYVDELNKKFNLSINGKELFILLSNPKNFVPYLTEAQLVKFSEERLNFTPSLIIEAMAKYFKATHKATK